MAKKKRTLVSSRAVCANAVNALDLMLSGYDEVIGPDFIITKNNRLDKDVGPLSPDVFNNYDQKFVDRLLKIKPKTQIDLPNLKIIAQNYLLMREALGNYQERLLEQVLSCDMDAGKELKIYDPYPNKIVIKNDAEMNVFYDYIALYRKLDGKRAVRHWNSKKPAKTFINKENKQVVTAYEKAQFSILRLDKNLSEGAIKVVDIVTKKPHILMDIALNRSEKEGCFFICSTLQMNGYIMTSGGGIPIDPHSKGGKATLTLLKKHLEKLKKSARPFNNNIMDCVREIYEFCMRGDALINMTVN